MSAKSLSKNATKNQVTPASLQRWNKYLAILYAVQGLVVLILSVARMYPVTTNFLGLDTLQTQAQGHTAFAAGTHHLFDVSLVWVVAIFLFMTAIAHGLAASKLRGAYEKDIKKGINRIRWIEYAFSASTMLVAIALLSATYDVSSLLMIWVLSAAANLLWLLAEVQSQKARKPNWLTFAFGCAAGIVPWIVLGIYFLSAHVYGSGVPSFVHWVYLSLFVLFAAVPANMYLQYRKVGNWTNYLYTERTYMIISLVAKTALAWQIFAGVLHP
ncbi:MAG TPA: heliorhodopsin HeR [Candidatus Saccharimonadales bacterium]|jgi:hypothetical protein